MGSIEDIRKILSDIPIWKRLGTVPAEVEDLKRRVAELEEKLGGKWPGEVCRFCGERQTRLFRTLGPDVTGIVTDVWRCGACGQSDHRMHKVT